MTQACPVIHSPLPNRIVDLRTFSALRMLFRSELRQSRTVQPEYLLEAAMEIFGASFGQQEGEDALDFAQREDEVTGSTAIPIGSEGTQERESPSSLPEAENMDDDEDNKSPHRPRATLYMIGTTAEHSSSLHDEQQHLKAADCIKSAAQSEVHQPAISRVG